MFKVLVKNPETNVERIAQVVVLDPPRTNERSFDNKPSSFSSHSPTTMLTFPLFSLPRNYDLVLNPEVTYLSPMLAFNLNLHLSCLKSLVHQGKETLASFFESEVDNATSEIEDRNLNISLELKSWSRLPGYASHLRASFVKRPECGTLESLRGRSSAEAEGRQEMIDLALHKYFEVDRYLTRGDLFSVHINWNCNSVMCIPCSQKTQDASGNVIYFKVK